MSPTRLILGAAIVALLACRAETLEDAERFAAAGDFARAREIIATLPDTAEANLARGRIELSARHLDDAASAFARVIDLSPERESEIAREYWRAARHVYASRPFTIDSMFHDAAVAAISHDESIASEISEWVIDVASETPSEKATRLLEIGAEIVPAERTLFASMIEESAREFLVNRNLAEAERTILRALAIDATMRSRAAVFYRDLAVEYAQENADAAREKLANALELSPFLAETDDDLTWLMRVKLQRDAPSGARAYLQAFPFGKYRETAEQLIATEPAIEGPDDPVQATILAIRHLAAAIERYSATANEYPRADTIDDLVAIIGDEIPIVDGWGNVFRVVSAPSRGYRIVSAGSDLDFEPGSRIFGVPAEPTEKLDHESDIVFENGMLLQ